MNKFLLGALLVPMTLLVACGKQDKKTSSVKLGSEIDTVSYALGMSQAPTPEMIKGYLMQAGSDSAYVDAFFKGMKDGYQRRRRQKGNGLPNGYASRYEREVASLPPKSNSKSSVRTPPSTSRATSSWPVCSTVRTA